AGNVVLEAQASGLPALVSRMGGPREHIVDGETGFVCGARDVGDFCARAVELIRNPARRREMGVAARRLALTRTWPAALAPLFGSYRGAGASWSRDRSPFAGRPAPLGTRA